MVDGSVDRYVDQVKKIAETVDVETLKVEAPTFWALIQKRLRGEL